MLSGKISFNEFVFSDSSALFLVGAFFCLFRIVVLMDDRLFVRFISWFCQWFSIRFWWHVVAAVFVSIFVFCASDGYRITMHPLPLTHLRQSTFAKLFQFIFAPCDGFFSLARWRENQFNGGSDGVYWPVTHASQQHRSRFTRIILLLSPIALRESENKSMWRVAHLSRCLL